MPLHSGTCHIQGERCWCFPTHRIYGTGILSVSNRDSASAEGPSSASHFDYSEDTFAAYLGEILIVSVANNANVILCMKVVHQELQH